MGKPVGRAATLIVVLAVGANSEGATLVVSWSGSLKVGSTVRVVGSGARAKEVSVKTKERPGSTTMALGSAVSEGAELGSSGSIDDDGLPLGKTMEGLSGGREETEGSGCDGSGWEGSG